jgi:hypothetical protein
MYIPVNKYPWNEQELEHKTLTCKNHPSARYLTKHAYARNLHLIEVPTDEGIERTDIGECTCPFLDMVVVVNFASLDSNAKCDLLAKMSLEMAFEAFFEDPQGCPVDADGLSVADLFNNFLMHYEWPGEIESWDWLREFVESHV